MAQRRYRGPSRSSMIDATAGPFERVVEDLARVTNSERELAYLENGYLVEGRVRLRPPFAPFALPAAVAGLAVQGLGHATARSGAVLNWLVAGGRLWVGVDEAPTTEVALGAIALSAAAERVYGVTFADYLIVSDGINRPFKVRLTTLVASVLTNFAEPAFGPPVVYYDKLFFILANKRTEIQWSEEGDPDNGYLGPCLDGAGGNYDNAWELRQTDQDALTLLVPSNQALAYARQQGIGLILGPVTSDFQSTGTHDAISRPLGTLSPAASVLLDDGRLWFIDQFGRPSIATFGAGGAREIVGPQLDLRIPLRRDRLARVLLAHHAELALVIVAHPLTSASGWPTTLLVFGDGSGQAGRSERTPPYQGRWLLPAGAEARALGVWRVQGLDVPEVLVVGDGQGRCWGLRDPLPIEHEDTTSADGSQTMPFTRFLRTAPLAYSPGATKLFDLAILQVANPPGADFTGPVLVSHITPASASVPVALTPLGQLANLTGGQDAPGYAHVGIAAVGSAIQLAVSTSDPASGYDVVALGVRGQLDGEQLVP